jgi:hypothetical protein
MCRTYWYAHLWRTTKKKLTESQIFSILTVPEWTDSRLFCLFNFEENLMRTSFVLWMLIFVCLSASAVPASAQQSAAQTAVPRLVQFSGVLKDAASRPVAGVSSVTFAVYADQEGGAALWSETQNVLADSNGHYSIVLGAATTGGFPVELFGTGQSRWLGVSVARQPEMPRILMASVPYALKAGDAETLGGLPAASYVTTQQLATRTTIPVVSGSGATVITTPGVPTAQSSGPATPNSAQSSVIDATPTGSGTTDFIPLWTSGSNLGNSILFQSGSSIGLGTTHPASTLDINGGEILRGGFYEYPQGTATASAGQPSHSFQWLASLYHSSSETSMDYAFGFRAVPAQNNVANPSAKLDLFYGTGGLDGSLTDTGFSFANNGIVTFALGQTFSGASETLTGSLNLPNTTSSTVGVITLGGTPFISNFGDPTNTFVGPNAGGGFKTSPLSYVTNTGVGESALYNISGGFNNTAVGGSALYGDTTGYANSAFGLNALANNQTGNANAAFGVGAGQSVQTGSSNTFLGNGANVSADPLTNATAVGASAMVGASNSLVLGSINGVNDATSNVNVGIGTSTPRSALELSSAASGTTSATPSLTLTNALGGANTTVSLDFNTYPNTATTNYNPSARIEAVDAGNGSDDIRFLINTPGSHNNGLTQILSMDTSGNVATRGNLAVGGTLSKAGGSFKIDDPIDPGGKYLSHSFVESPDMMNIYNGSVILNAKGEAVVTMPEWFSALNRDFQYQLTAIGGPAPHLYVATEIQDNQFKIAGGKKGQKISWMVTGIRQDAWANAHRIPTEEEKPANEQGRYLHPELFGAGPDKSVNATTTGALSIEAAKTSADPTVTEGGNR